MQLFLIYLFLQTLYMFQTVPRPIVRNTTVHTASGIVNQHCCWLLSWMEFQLSHDSIKQQY